MHCQGPNCTRDIIQGPGGHRPRRFCSDRCRMAASRWRLEQAERARMKAEEEARGVRERVELRSRYPMITAESIDLLRGFKQQFGLPMVSVVGAALVREHEQAKDNLKRLKQERRIVEHQAMQVGKQRGYPAIDELELEAGEPTWWVWIIDDRNDLARLFAALTVTVEARSTTEFVTIDG